MYFYLTSRLEVVQLLLVVCAACIGQQCVAYAYSMNDGDSLSDLDGGNGNGGGASNHTDGNLRLEAVGTVLAVEETSSLSTKAFFDNYVDARKAVLLRGAVANTPAFELWKNDDYLIDTAMPYEEYKVLVEVKNVDTQQQELVKYSLYDFMLNYNSVTMFLVDEVPAYLRKDVTLPQVLQCDQATETLDDAVGFFFFFFNF